MSDSPLTHDARTVAADLFERFASLVVNRLARAFPGTDGQILCDACVQAILEISRDPARYQQERGSLRSFLLGAARRRLGTFLRSDRRRRQREQEKAIDPVTAEAPAERSSLEQLASLELADRARAAIALTDEERGVLDLWLLGQADVTAYATTLGWTDLPRDQQEARLRQIQARLRQRLHRYRERFREEGPET
jgi:DNA-directed RNA polymerase specialized sigma24 family protein